MYLMGNILHIPIYDFSKGFASKGKKCILAFQKQNWQVKFTNTHV